MQAQHRRRIDVISPHSEESIGTSHGGDRDVDRAVIAARKAFDDGPWPRHRRPSVSRLNRLAELYKSTAKRWRS